MRLKLHGTEYCDGISFGEMDAEGKRTFTEFIRCEGVGVHAFNGEIFSSLSGTLKLRRFSVPDSAGRQSERVRHAGVCPRKTASFAQEWKRPEWKALAYRRL